MSEPPISEQDRRRRRALYVFQFVMYGFLLGMFLLQLHIYSKSNW